MRPPLTNAVLTLLLFLAVGTGYHFWYGAIEDKSASVAELERLIVSSTETEARIAAARASLAGVAGAEGNVQDYFVTDSRVVSFINALESRGTTLGTTVKVLSVAKGTTGGRPMFTFSLAINGTFDAVMRTVGAIENAPYAVMVTNFGIRHQEQTQWGADLTLSVGSTASITATSTP
ncbi:MAG: hypothetical protein AAB442_01200 [Patescibacteria group bacterium]